MAGVLALMQWWLCMAGTGARPYSEEDRVGRPPRHRFPRRPGIQRGDMLAIYASGSAREYGEGRVFSIEECVSDEPEPSGDERWRWQVATRRIVSVALPLAPTLRDLAVSPRSIGRHSHIRLTQRQGELALAAFAAVDEARRPDFVGDVPSWAGTRPRRAIDRIPERGA